MELMKLKEVAATAASDLDWPSAMQDFLKEATPVAVLELIALVEQQEAELATLRTQLGYEAKPNDSQDWAKISGTVAFHLIERHADDWSEAGDMMEAFAASRVANATPQAQPALTDAQIDSAIAAFEEAACTETYSVRAGVKAVLDFAATLQAQPAKRIWPDSKQFALVRDRTYDGAGLQLAVHDGVNYVFSDGDCYDRDGDTLDGYTAEFLTDHELEQRLNAAAQCAAPDERAAFEAWAGIEYRNAIYYDTIEFQHGLNAWLARASLAAQPAKVEAQQAMRDYSMPVVYSDDDAVDLFAAAMKAKMAASRAKGRSGWNDPEQCAADTLRAMMASHITKGDPVDVGNFCMMLWNRSESTATPAPAMGEELPPLPACDVIAYSCIGENDAYSPDATRAYARACMALRQPADKLIAEQNKLAKERQEWAHHQSDVIRGLNARIAELEVAQKVAVQEPYAWINSGIERQQEVYATLSVGPENPWMEGANAFPVYTAPPPAPVAAPAVAEGWKCVPETSTSAMDRAGENAYEANGHCECGNANGCGMEEVFSAMLAAAPSAPVGGSHD